MVVALAGRAAEEIVFDSVTTGASNDIEKATGIARAMITQYGMSEKFGLMGIAKQQDQYLSGRVVMDCGEATAAAVDDEVMRILKDAYEEAKRLLTENRDVMDQIAVFLIEKETITGKEFMQIFRKCKGIPEPEEHPEGEAQSGQLAGAPEQAGTEDVTDALENEGMQEVTGVPEHASTEAAADAQKQESTEAATDASENEKTK